MAAAAAIRERVLTPAGVPMVDPVVQVLVPEDDRVLIQWVALPVIALPVMAVQGGRTTPGVRV